MKDQYDKGYNAYHNNEIFDANQATPWCNGWLDAEAEQVWPADDSYDEDLDYGE